MSHRLQVLISPDLDSQIEKAAERSRISKGEWVRRAIEARLRQAGKGTAANSLDRMASLNGPIAGIDRMLDEIEAGRR